MKLTITVIIKNQERKDNKRNSEMGIISPIFVQSCKEKGSMWGRPSLSSKREENIFVGYVPYTNLPAYCQEKIFLRTPNRQRYFVKTKAKHSLDIWIWHWGVSSPVGRDDDNSKHTVKNKNLIFELLF